MKIADVVSQLRKLVPQLTDLFSTVIPVVSIVGDGSFINVETVSPHNLSNGDFVNLSGVKVETPIIEAQQNGNNIKFQTNTNTDLTFSWPPHEFVSLEGFTDPNLNDSFKLVASVNRRLFEIDAGEIVAPASLNGEEVLLEEVLGRFNGPSLINVVDANNFIFESTVLGSGIGGLVHSNIRITGMATLVRADEQYTQQDVDDWWMVVVPIASADVDKSRRTETDLNNESGPETDFQNYIMDGFNVYVYANASETSGGLEVMDIARSEVLAALLSSIRGFKLPSALSSESNQFINLSTHGLARYDRSVYVHQFIFQAPEIMTVEDAVLPETVAFRDIPFTSEIGSEELIVNVDLDEDPEATLLSYHNLPSSIPISYFFDILGLRLWLDASDIDTIIESGGSVSQWNDKSNEGNSVLQLSGGSQPTTGQAVDAINGVNAIRFDGVSQFLQRLSFIGGALSQPNTIFIVWELLSLPDSLAKLIDGGFGGNRHIIELNNINDWRMWAGAFATGTVKDINTPYIITSLFNTTASEGYVNGVLDIVGDVSINSLEGITIGTRFNGVHPLNVKIGEIVIFDRALIPVERDTIETYLANKWSI